MFSFICALPSPASAGSCPPLFGRFTGSTAQSDFSSACVSVVRLCAFTDRPSSITEGALEISRFSCMLFPSVRGLCRLRRTGQPLASNAAAVLPSSYSSGSRHPDLAFFEAQSPRPPMPRSTLRNTPRDVPRKTRGQDGVAFSFPVGLLHPLQHAGLSRRTTHNVLFVDEANDSECDVGDPEVKQTLLSPVPVGRKKPISLKIAGQDFEFPIAKA